MTGPFTDDRARTLLGMLGKEQLAALVIIASGVPWDGLVESLLAYGLVKRDDQQKLTLTSRGKRCALLLPDRKVA